MVVAHWEKRAAATFSGPVRGAGSRRFRDAGLRARGWSAAEKTGATSEGWTSSGFFSPVSSTACRTHSLAVTRGSVSVRNRGCDWAAEIRRTGMGAGLPEASWGSVTGAPEFLSLRRAASTHAPAVLPPVGAAAAARPVEGATTVSTAITSSSNRTSPISIFTPGSSSESGVSLPPISTGGSAQWAWM